jgi:hypothetical protein
VAEKELEIYGEIGLLPKAGIVWRRRWGDRITQLVEDAAAIGATTPAAVDGRAEENEAFGDILLSAADRATHIADPQYRRTLARLVAIAMDDSLIDEIAYLTAQLVALQPLELRILAHPADGHAFGHYQQFELRRAFGVSDGLIYAAMRSLEKVGFVNPPEDQSVLKASGSELDVEPTLIEPRGDEWKLTEWGRSAFDRLFPDLGFGF